MPAFESELNVDRQSVPTAVLDEVLADPEAETYQFVFTAVPNNGSIQTARLSERYLELQAEHQRQIVTATKRSTRPRTRIEGRT